MSELEADAVVGYELLAVVGETAGSTIYRARRLADAMPVLLKVPSATVQVADLRREYELLDSLRGPGVPHTLELLHVASRHVIVLAACDGDLLASAPTARRPMRCVLRLGLNLAEALARLHDAQLVHRDVRPCNLIHDPSTDQVWLVDLSRTAQTGTATGDDTALQDDLAYSSPEQAGWMHHPVDARSDLYSVGVVLYELLGGALPFQADDTLEWLHCHLARTPRPLAELAPDLPHTVSDVVMKLLAKPPDDRYQSARGLVADLTRCLAQWDAAGEIEPFTLGRHDLADRIDIPSKLHGRERELQELLDAYRRVAATGTTEFVLISGYSGIGKSSLVTEFQQHVLRDRSFFVSGKFDLCKRDVPHAIFTEAFRVLVQQLLSTSEHEIEEWRARLRDTLGAHGQAIVALIPELELVIGRQPQLPVLGPLEAQNRFWAVFRQFLGVFARPERPLVLFLDDLQWLDPGSRMLMQSLVSHSETRNLLIIGAYRDNEVPATHPLALSLNEMRMSGAQISNIELAPISRPHLAAFVADILHCDVASAAPLAELIHDKTGGNPFFAIQFVLSIHDRGLIALDRERGAFQWNIARLREESFTDNVAALMAEKVRRLPSRTQQALSRLACLGNAAGLELLATAAGISEAEADAELRDAVVAGLVIRARGGYRFLHDRVQEAAYALIPEDQRAATHLVIGRRLLLHLSDEQLEERLFEIVNQWNVGVGLVTENQERATLGRLDLRAGRRARASTAYGSACTYFALAVELLPPDAWSAQYAATFELHLDLAESEYLAGAYERADEVLDVAVHHARSVVDQAKVQRVRMRLHQLAGRPREAVHVMLDALRLLGVSFPETTAELHAAGQAELRQIRRHLAEHTIPELVNAPLATDPCVAEIIGLLDEGMPPTYTAWPALWPVLCGRVTNLSLQHGNTDASAFGYIGCALILRSLEGDVATAFQLSSMAIQLNERFESTRSKLRGKLLFHHAAMVEIWCRSFTTAVPKVEEAFVACLDVGDLVFAGYLTYNHVWLLFESGAPLEQIAEVAWKYVAFGRDNHIDLPRQVVRSQAQFVARLRGAPPTSPHALVGDGFDQAESIKSLELAGFNVGVAFIHIMGQITAFLDGRYGDALESARNAAKVVDAVRALASEATHSFYLALTAAALYPEAALEQQHGLAQTLAEALLKHQRWAEHCPQNFGNRRDLIAAEIARVEGREGDAARLYEAAIRAAHDQGLVHIEAIAWETAARFYRARGFDKIAETYLGEAHTCFARWGTRGEPGQPERLHVPGAELHAVKRMEKLDLLAVIKASQAISREILLDQLASTLMNVVLESAGAQTAALLLGGGPSTTPSVAALATVDARGTRVRSHEVGPLEASELPLSIINYVRRTRERVLLADATQPSAFSSDPYFVGRRTRSILALPIVRQAELTGVLYLENNLVPDAFSADRVAVLELLASQAAISLENARLYADLHRENRERQQAEAALRESKDLLQGIIDNSNALIYVKDLEGRFLLANRRLATSLHTEAASIVGMTDYDFFPREHADAFRAVDRRVIDTRTPLEVEEVGALEGDVRTYFSLKAPLFGPDGRPFALCAISTEITERKRAEAALRRTEEQLRQSQKMEAIGNLAGGIAHDFNNLLSIILSYSSMLSADMLPNDPRQADLHEIEAAGERAAQLTHQLLAFGRKQILQPRLVDLRQIVAGMERMLRRLIGEDVELTVLSGTGLALVTVDPSQMEQIIMNLAVNSRDAMPLGGKLTIETSNIVLDERYAADHVGVTPGPHVMLAVSDTGSGMDTGTLARMFEPFFTTKEPGKGTGLGLATVFGIVQQSGGNVWVYSEPGMGTTFKIYFPRATELGPELVESGVPTARLTGGTETILLVEDDEQVRVLARTILARSGYAVLECQSGEDAMRICEQHRAKIHLLLTDVIMPRMSGRQLADRVRRLRPEIEVVYMSGYTDGSIVHHGVLDSSVDFLQKPIIPESLTRKVREVLDRGR